jgi:hypothetical protein
MSHAKRRASIRWTEEDTNRFFRYLAAWGTDFESIARMFPGRDRWGGGGLLLARGGGRPVVAACSTQS